MKNGLAARFRQALPKGTDFCSLRYYSETTEELSVRNDVVEPVSIGVDSGAMVTVVKGGGAGYAATSDLSLSGLQRAIRQATLWADRAASRSVYDSRGIHPSPTGSYASPVEIGWETMSVADKLALLREVCTSLALHAHIVERQCSLSYLKVETELITSEGGRIEQVQQMVIPDAVVYASRGGDTMRRSFGLRGLCQQGGLETLARFQYQRQARELAVEALQLLDAPNCPSEKMDLLLMPDQMMLQIHESIGHPIELDRILGDERNYAGTSFVSKDMFGTYQYGSELLNVTFDPEIREQFATYRWDDDGSEATREAVIEGGLLVRPLGGAVSQARAGLPGVSCARASSWNRPPMDRMANLNIEPGSSSLQQLIASVERGVLMKTNQSWSIDDSRNKFQFGCEWGQLIEDGALTTVVKNPNYRGISATFWRNLKGVGDRSTFEIFGTPYCGKGEPNQVIRVGHASPACLFADIDVFGGE